MTPARRVELATLAQRAFPELREALAEVDRLTARAQELEARVSRLNAAYAERDALRNEKAEWAKQGASDLVERDRLTARWEALKAWAKDCDLSVDVDDMSIEMIRLERLP